MRYCLSLEVIFLINRVNELKSQIFAVPLLKSAARNCALSALLTLALCQMTQNLALHGQVNYVFYSPSPLIGWSDFPALYFDI